MQFKQVVWLMATVVLLASCSSSKKSTSSRSVEEVILSRKSVRVVTGSNTSRKDNGLHKGWYKNPNNPHHPNTTNPGHTKKGERQKQRQEKVIFTFKVLKAGAIVLNYSACLFYARLVIKYM